MKIAVIIPTIREDQINAFLGAWGMLIEKHKACLYVLEDNPSVQFKIKSSLGPDRLKHLSWKDAPKGMMDCVSVKTPASRMIGVWKAYMDGCDLFITLDDDVRPVETSDLIQEFRSILADGLPLWVDPISNYQSRGYPEKNSGRIRPVFHIGSFFGIPDVYGETQLEHEKNFEKNPPKYVDRPVVMNERQLIPVNGGICGWTREIVPFVHYTVDSKACDYQRHEDIWMGIILKRCLDLSGRHMSYGPPYVNHFRASDARINAERETRGKEFNEMLWQLLDSAIAGESGPMSLREAHDKVASALASFENEWARAESKAMLHWRSLLEAAAPV